MYDTDVNVYTEDGRIKQVEFAMKSMNLGATTVAAVIGDEIVFVSEKKKVNCLQKTENMKKHFKLSKNAIAAFAGVTSDAPKLLRISRFLSSHHQFYYNTPIPAKLMLDDLCAVALMFGEEDDKSIYPRPFGVNMLVGIKEERPRLFCIDPSGSYVEVTRCAIGSGSEVINLDGDLTEEILKERLRAVCVGKDVELAVSRI